MNQAHQTLREYAKAKCSALAAPRPQFSLAVLLLCLPASGSDHLQARSFGVRPLSFGVRPLASGFGKPLEATWGGPLNNDIALRAAHRTSVGMRFTVRLRLIQQHAPPGPYRYVFGSTIEVSMPRRSRIVIPDVPLHIIQRGNNRGECFRRDADFLVYLTLLHEAVERAGCRIHAYVLMSNHVHLLATPLTARSAAMLMKSVGERYVRYFNKRYQRTGTLFDCRFRSSVIHDASYLITCYRYIELNPVRAGMTLDPSTYRWSSYHANATGAPDRVVTPHPLFLALGSSAEKRQLNYRALLHDALDLDEIKKIRDATNHNYVCGTADFQAQVTKMLGIAAVRTRRPPTQTF